MQGINNFAAKLNIEVQWTTEAVIAAVEKNGGTISTRYYCPRSVRALTNPKEYFTRGTPIPKCLYPPNVSKILYNT